MSQSKSCLVISYGPVPTPQYQKIEGGGMRCWGLALGLQQNGYDVTVAINQSFPLDISSQDDIALINWQEDEEFADLINTFDAVIINYSMGGPMSYIVDHISDHVMLVLDCYVPIYIEVSARNAKDMPTEYRNYSVDLTHWNKALMRGDYFLCANEPQKHMYTGALGALGILNPYSYKTNRVLVVPFGVEESLTINNPHNPYTELGIKKNDFTLLWFGGLYPWFNIKPLLATIKRLSKEFDNFKFVIVGGKNPYNQNPDFQRQYDETYKFIKSNHLLDKSVFFVDWVDYNDRINWYQHANIVISINSPGEENTYSWRTRVMDFVWGEIPMITNGGDPLSDSLISANAAIKLANTSEETLYNELQALIVDKKRTKKLKNAVANQKKLYYWSNVVRPISIAISSDYKPYLAEKKFKLDNRLQPTAPQTPPSRIKKLSRAPRRIVGIIRRKGVKRSAAVAYSTIANRMKRAKSTVKGKRYFFFSHPIDYTGAPLVLLDVIKDFTEKVPAKNISLIYPGGEKPLINRIRKLGISLDKAVLGIGGRLIRAQLGIKKDDFVLLNTVAIYSNYRDCILWMLETDQLNEATWFIHEDKPELRFGEDKGLINRIENLIKSGKLKIFVPSHQTAEEYNDYFSTDKIKVITLRVEVPEIYESEHKTSDFNTIRFMLSGTSTDGRKGQLLAISALAKLQAEYISKDPSQYRDFSLTLLAVGKDDYISSQVRSIGKGLLGNKVAFYETKPKDEAMEFTSKCNATICSSLNETFGLFVAEGMLMGHILIRNKASGYHEQIVDGKNGYLVNTNNINEFTKILEKIVNKNQSNADLKKMSDSSFEMAQKFKKANYYDQLIN
ncbi:MAG: glycosyltransferase family 1 protein [Candidatus Saccharimonas sp.]|nr:MAG: glycosyltransferase family 1 protein [Candidatus Saccharimonas sp.]